MSRFGKALIVALALHGVLAARWLVSAPAALTPSTKTSATELQIELESAERPPSAAMADTPPTAEPAALEHSVIASLTASAARSAATQAVPSAAAVEPPQTFAMLEGDGEPSDSTATTRQPEPAAPQVPKIDLGLDGRMFRLSSHDVQARQPTRRDVGAELERNLNASLNASLAADDVERGHARGNVLTGSLSSAVRTAGPASGDAIIRVTINSLGELSELKLLRGAISEWSVALQSFREQAKRKRVRVPSGAQGLRITFNVSTKLQRPSGKAVESSTIGVKRPSLAPSGLTLRGDFDVADLSNKTNRMVYATVLTEEVL